MKTNNEKAHELVDLGLGLVPLIVRPDGSKVAGIKEWSEKFLTTHDAVDGHWYPKREVPPLIGWLHHEYGAIDIDTKNGKNGWEMLKKHGLELPETPVWYDTPNGGRHYIYKFPQWVTKAVDIRYKGIELEGVDRCFKNGLAIWYGDVPTAEKLASVPDAPEWSYAYENNKSDYEPPKSPQEWFEALPRGEIGPSIRKILDSVIPGQIDHNKMVNVQFAIVSEGAKGVAGAKEALTEFMNLYLSGKYDTAEYLTEWNNAMNGLLKRIPEIEAKTKETDEDSFETRVQKKMVDIEVAETAKKRRMEAIYQGTTDWDWADLESVSVEYVLEGLLYKGSVNGFVGRSQIGKTFAMVSMLGALATGRDWFGLKTQQQRIMYVAGEGTGGIAARFKDWAEAEGVDWDEAKQNIKIVTDVDLYFDLSIEQLQAISMRFAPDIIVYDTLSSNATIESENDAANMAQLLANAKKVYPEAIVLFVHHPSEATKNLPNPKPRGSSVFYSNLDNIITITVDGKFKSNALIPSYSNGKAVQFLTISTDFEEHGGKSKEGSPAIMKGFYLKEFESGRIVFAQTNGSRQHSHNTLIDMILKYLADEGRDCTVNAFWNAAEELGLKDSTDPNGGWKSNKGARNILETAVERGYLVENKKSGPLGSTYSYPILPDYNF